MILMVFEYSRKHYLSNDLVVAERILGTCYGPCRKHSKDGDNTCLQKVREAGSEVVDDQIPDTLSVGDIEALSAKPR